MLVRKETSPEDVAGMHLAKGILTATGGKASPRGGRRPRLGQALRGRLRRDRDRRDGRPDLASTAMS